MKSTSAKFFFLSLLFLALACRGADAAAGKSSGGEDLENVPSISSFTFSQMGGNDLMMDINGNNMPLPQVTGDGNITMIVLPGVSGEKVSEYENDGLHPLVTAVRSRQTGEDFVITVMTSRPIQVNAVRGVPPCDVYTLQFKTREELRKVVEERVATDHPQTMRVPTGPFASNEPITLDLRDTELRDVFRMFGEQVKKNIIIHDSMPPVLVTMTFKKAPLSNVFSYLMKTYDLAYEFLDKDTIVVGTAAGLASISGTVETRAYRIAYADPAALSALLPNLTRIQATALVVDPRLRTLYVTATPDIHEEVTIAVQKLDHPGKQVMLHARILSFLKGDELEVAHALNGVYDHWAFSYGGESGLGLVYADDNPDDSDYRRGTINDSNVLLPGNLTSIATPMNAVWREFDASLSALESKTHFKVLANPSVVTIDGSPATVTLATEYVYRSGYDENGNPEYDTFEVGPVMTITPRIGRDNTITLTLDLQSSQQASAATGDIDAIVAKANRQVITNVRVRNGEPFVVGGLFSEDNTIDRFRIPILGQLPLLGELFTFRRRNSNIEQVVMVVIPYILDTPDTAVEFERVMMKR